MRPCVRLILGRVNKVLNIEELRVSYGNVIAIDGVTIHASTGEFIAVIGANGAGKTTLLNAILGFLPVSSGRITYQDKRIDGHSPEQRVKCGIALVSEDRNLFGRMSVEDNLRLGAYLTHRRQQQATLERVYTLLPKLKERRKQEVATLSGGEQQMVAIGRALMSEPQTILLDEPSTGLAPIIVQQIFATIHALKQHGMTAIIVEQNAPLALSVADRAYVLELGKVIKEGTAAEIRSDESLSEAYFGK